MVQKLRTESVLIGCTLDPHAAFLVQRGLKTYFVRYQAQCRTAHELSAWLEQQPGVSRVIYPGLESHPQQALAAAQQQDFGTLNCVELAGGLAAATRFAEALDLFAMTASLGSVDSLVNPPPFMKPLDLSPEQLAISGITPGMVRLSFGLEDVEDLRADLEQALAAVNG
jgi:cystathionine beta-lyase/cystathionine gamma-synthase